MEFDLEKVAEIVESSEKIQGKIDILDIYFDILGVIYNGSRKEEAKQNVNVLEKIIEHIVNKIDESERESIDASSFVRIFYKYLYKANFMIKPESVVSLKIIEHEYPDSIKFNSHNIVIDSFDDLSLLEKTCLSIVYRELEAKFIEETADFFGDDKTSEILFDFSPVALKILYDSIDSAILDDEMTIEDLVNIIKTKIAKETKNIFIDKYQCGELDLRKCSSSKFYDNLSKKDKIPMFVSDIYERTGFINDNDSDAEFVKDCCLLLNITEEQYKKEYNISGNISHLKLIKLLRNLNFGKE